MVKGSAALKSLTELEKRVSPAMGEAAENLVGIDSIAKEVGYLCAAASRQRRDHCCRHPAVGLDSSARKTDYPTRQS